MKHVHLTWYLLVDGTQADPDDVSPGNDGVLRHKNGMPVALRDDGTPMTIGRAAKDNKNVEAAQAGEEAAAVAKKQTAGDAAALKAEAATPVVTEIDPATGKKQDEAKDIKAEPAKKQYKTRESKAG